MDLIWWLPAVVLIVGSLLLLTRIRVIEREIAATTQATAQLARVGESGAILTAAVARTETRRTRTTDALTQARTGAPDRGPSGADR